MEFTFLKNGKVAFFRSDAEQADWTQEEMSLFCSFPYDPKKIIERGMTVLFRDPATGSWIAHEIRNCQVYPGDSYQQITTEELAISELTDCHIADETELTDVTAQTALSQVLQGTGWQVGNSNATNISSGDILRGSAWESVNAIARNWNVHIVPRVTVASGGITGRFLDILSPEGTWRGFRVAIDKNVTDPCVVYDDSELYTALYAYGATVSEGDVEHPVTVETNIGGIAWSKTPDHPAKPSGQKYLEYPEMTALYGRNGKPRFGYYQNMDITDPNVLIQKTWETLKTVSQPKISITGTVTDLKRLGYVDVPIRLWDMAAVDLGDIVLFRQIIRLTVNLLDPTGNTPTIGDYIPNIVYINRETDDVATGGSRGAGGGRGSTRSSKEKGEFETHIFQNERNISLQAIQVDKNRETLRAAGIDIDPITGIVIYHNDVENSIGANFTVQSNRITAEVTQRENDIAVANSRITQTANQLSLEVSQRKSEDTNLRGQIKVNADKVSIVVEEKNGAYVANAASIVAGINGQSGSYVRIRANTIDLSGYVTVSELNATNAAINNLVSGQTLASAIKVSNLTITNSLMYAARTITTQQITINGTTYYLLGYR